MQLQAGQRVAARLRLLRPLRRGGMGAIWVARHETLGSEVAVKFIRQTLSSHHPQSSERFRREASIAATLSSPHVARTYDYDVLPDGTPFIVMELLRGESLSQRLKRRGRLSLRETSLILSQAAHALTRAHQLRIVHRDIKPSNMFLIDSDYELFLKLLDFGIAKQVSVLSGGRLTQTGTILGSPHYMSPESLTQTRDVDGRSDLWALAVVAYECLTGVRPFEGESLMEIARAVMDIDYEPPRMLRPQLPEAVDAWFRTAFHSAVERRHRSARELAESFAAIARDDGTTAAAPGEASPSPGTAPSPSEEPTSLLAARPSLSALPAAPRPHQPSPYETPTPGSLAAGVSAVVRSIGPALSTPPPRDAPRSEGDDRRAAGRSRWTVSPLVMLLLGAGLACAMLGGLLLL